MTPQKIRKNYQDLVGKKIIFLLKNLIKIIAKS